MKNVLFLLAAFSVVGTTLQAGELHEAAISGDVEKIRTLIDGSKDIDEIGSQGASALLWAATYGKDNVVKLLIANGANVNFSTSNGITPLIMASQYGNKDVIETLLNNGANVNAKTPGGFTALEQAVNTGETEVAKILIESGAEVNGKLDSGKSVLHEAASSDSEEIAGLLIRNGANVNATTDTDNKTPLFIAANRGNLAVVRLLLKAGANPNISLKNTPTPRSPIMTAAWNRSIDEKRYMSVVKLLLKHGAKDEWLSLVPGFDPIKFEQLTLSISDKGTVMVGGIPFFLGQYIAIRPWKMPVPDSSSGGTNYFSWENQSTNDSVTVVVIKDTDKNSTGLSILPPAFFGENGIVYREGVSVVKSDGPFAKIDVSWDNKPITGEVVIVRGTKSKPFKMGDKTFSHFLKEVKQNEPITVEFKENGIPINKVSFDIIYRGATQEAVSYAIQH